MGTTNKKQLPVRSILAVRLTGWADTTLCNFAASALKERYPEAKVTLLTSDEFQDWGTCLNFDHLIYISESLYFSKSFFKRKLYHFWIWLKIIWSGFDMAINFQSQKGMDRLLRFSFIRRKTQIIRDPKRSQLDDILKLLETVDTKPSKLNFKLKVHQRTHDLVMERLGIFALEPHSFLVVNPGGGIGHRRKFKNQRWPYFVEFLKLFLERSNWPILLLGELCDSDLVLPLTEVDPKRVHSWMGQATREEMLAAVAQAGAFIGCDSGLAFVAGSVGVPSVVLYGPRSSTTHAPPGNMKTVICLDAKAPCSPCFDGIQDFNWQCDDNVCMKTMSPSDIYRAFEKALKMNTPT